MISSKMNGAKPKQNRITRNIHKEISLLRRRKPYASNRSAFLISDSKGKDLKYLNERKYYKDFIIKEGQKLRTSTFKTSPNFR